ELLADARADGGDDRLDLVVRQNLVDAVLLGVDDLPAERQDRLEGVVATLLRGAAGGVALDDEEFGRLGIADAAVGELAGERRAAQRALARQLARLPRRQPRARGRGGLAQDRPRVVRILLE